MNNIQSALSFISPDCPRDDWVNILMAIKSELGDGGYELANEWSQQGVNYTPADFKATWKSIKPSGGITIATLFKQARDNGFQPNYLAPFTPTTNGGRSAKQQQAEIAEQRAIERRIQSVANFWKTLKSKHPPQPCLNHPYLERKGIQPHGVHYLPSYKDKFTAEHGDDPLVLWVMKEARLTGFQFIYPDGFKRFLAGTVKQGGYYLVTKDKDPQTADKVVLCEGFATACSVVEHRYPKAMAYIAFDAGNLPGVAVYLRSLYPGKQIIICADNDHAAEEATGNNPGTEYGKRAALLSGADFERPLFIGDHAERYSDWNDYYQIKSKREGNDGNNH